MTGNRFTTDYNNFIVLIYIVSTLRRRDNKNLVPAGFKFERAFQWKNARFVMLRHGARGK